MDGTPQATTSDSALIRRFLDGDERAFRTLYRRHTPRLRMLVLRLVRYDDADADDVVQDAWLACCRALADFRGDSAFGTWLTTIGIRAARARMRRAFSTSRQSDGVEQLALRQAPAPIDAAIDAAIDAERALRLLADRERIVFVLHYLEGMPHDDIAAALGIAAGTSRATLSRALTTLRAHYGTEVAS